MTRLVLDKVNRGDFYKLTNLILDSLERGEREITVYVDDFYFERLAEIRLDGNKLMFRGFGEDNWREIYRTHNTIKRELIESFYVYLQS